MSKKVQFFRYNPGVPRMSIIDERVIEDVENPMIPEWINIILTRYDNFYGDQQTKFRFVDRDY